MKGIQFKIGLLFLIYLILVVVGASTTYLSVMEQKADGRVINIAGAQRMLSQRMAKEALLIQASQGRDAKVLESFASTTGLFTKQLRGLLNGDDSLSLPRTTNAEARTILEGVETTWTSLAADVEAIRGGAHTAEAVQRLVTTSLALLTESNKAVLALEAENQSKINRLVLIQVGFLVAAVIISVAAWVLIRRGIVRPLMRTADAAKRLAAGDLTVEPLALSQKDEVGDTARAFDAMVSTLRRLVGEITDSTQSVLSAAEELSAASEQSAAGAGQATDRIGLMAKGATTQATAALSVNQAVQEVGLSTEQIAQGAQQTATEVQAASALLGEMASSIEVVATSAASVAENTALAAGTARNGAEVVERAIDGMQRIGQAVGVSAERMRKLEEFSTQIGEITQVISEIAEQTNLLALNAAIEAARAGEHGRGFAVAAEEVRRLAERSATSAREITELIVNIQNRTSEAVKSMEQGFTEVENGNRLAADTGRALQEILTMVGRAAQEGQSIAQAATLVRESAGRVVQAFDSVASVTEENSAATEQMAAATEQAVHGLEQVTGVARENASLAEEVSRMTEELASSATEVAQAAQGLTGIAQDLQSQVSRFTV